MKGESIPESAVDPAAQPGISIEPISSADTIGLPPVSATRKRGKCMSRRAGQNPSVRIRFNRRKGIEEYFFQYWIDVPGREKRKRETEIIGPVKTMTKSEAERKKLEFILNLKVNSNEYKIPSSLTFAQTVKHYREIFAPRMLRHSTFSMADGHLKEHLEARLERYSDRAHRHRRSERVDLEETEARCLGSWLRIFCEPCNVFFLVARRTRKPPFSQEGLAIPERDKLQMKIESRQAISFSWTDTASE